jgi:hypothetical protein
MEVVYPSSPLLALTELSRARWLRALTKVQRGAGAGVAKIRNRVLVVDDTLTVRENKHDKLSTSLGRPCVVVARKRSGWIFDCECLFSRATEAIWDMRVEPEMR